MIKSNLFIRTSCFLLAAAMVTAGCSPKKNTQNPAAVETENTKENVSELPLDYQVTPETFSLSFKTEDGLLKAAMDGQPKKVAGFEKNGGETSWQYPEEQVSVSIRPVEDYLHVTISADTKSDLTFTWPEISADHYYLPLGEGKQIPARDQIWRDYLEGQEFSVLEQLSMPFWAAAEGNHAILFIMEQPFRSNLNFTGSPSISFAVSHEYPAIDENRSNSYRIYLTENNPVTIAKLYKNYVEETKGLVTLEEKAAKNPNIRKLYGAPFIYLWGDFVLSQEDINWNLFRSAIDSPVMNYLLSFSEKTENGKEFATVLKELKSQDYAAVYQKNVVCSYLSQVLKREDFLNEKQLPLSSPELKSLLNPGYEALKPYEKIQANKLSLAANLPDVFQEADRWLDSETVDLLKDMKESGIGQAWIGLNSWEQAYVKPQLIETAVSQDYLIGSYDSYHSIHQPGREQWITAAFEDTSLYENASVTDQKGNKISGFKEVGRKLNPTLSLPAVKERLNRIMNNGLPFNSWFIDCDATGEIYDDYTPGRRTTQQMDLEARLERMAYIRDTYQMVIGSEGGNDFAASDIAYAHGLELKTFSWMDQDMKENKDSEYYIGKYYNPAGGVAEHFSKRIPVKEHLYTVFADPRYDVPLFKLVYHNSVITSYHWDWSTFKIQGATKERMVREILYDVPPLYHLDSAEWEEYKEDLVNHTKVWSEFSKKAVLEEMTDFNRLLEDGSVQLTQYGDGIFVVANFNDFTYSYEGQEIPGQSALISIGGNSTIYTPQTEPEHS